MSEHPESAMSAQRLAEMDTIVAAWALTRRTTGDSNWAKAQGMADWLGEALAEVRRLTAENELLDMTLAAMERLRADLFRIAIENQRLRAAADRAAAALPGVPEPARSADVCRCGHTYLFHANGNHRTVDGCDQPCDCDHFDRAASDA